VITRARRVVASIDRTSVVVAFSARVAFSVGLRRRGDDGERVEM